MMAFRGLAGVARDRRGALSRRRPGRGDRVSRTGGAARPGGGDHGRGQRRAECRGLGVAARDEGVAMGRARLGVAPDLRDGVVGVEVCHLLAPVGNRGNEAGEPGQRPGR